MAARHAVLALLLDRPGHPYDLAARFDHKVGKAWDLKRGQVYLTLQRLEREGLVEVAARRGAGVHAGSIFRATDRGRRVFEDWLRCPDAGSVPPLRSDLLIKLAFGGCNHALHLLDLVADREREAQALLQEHADAARRAADTACGHEPWRELLLQVVHGAAIAHLEAELQWLARVHALLETYVASKSVHA
jgi:DNA-binding PadR family transcriptional regulator